MLYGRLPKIIISFWLILFKLYFKISELCKLMFLIFTNLFLSNSQNLSSFYISVKCLGFSINILFVRFPEPGPIS